MDSFCTSLDLGGRFIHQVFTRPRGFISIYFLWHTAEAQSPALNRGFYFCKLELVLHYDFCNDLMRKGDASKSY